MAREREPRLVGQGHAIAFLITGLAYNIFGTIWGGLTYWLFPSSRRIFGEIWQTKSHRAGRNDRAGTPLVTPLVAVPKPRGLALK
jgi:hypothetical protein